MMEDFLKLLKTNSTISPEDLEKAEVEFLRFNIVEKENVWVELKDYFANTTPAEDRFFWFSYWRWFTDLSWKLFQSREREFAIDVALKRQIPAAVLLDFDVAHEIIRYLAMRAVDEKDLQSLYLRMKKNFLESDAVIGSWQGVEVLQKDLIEEIKRTSLPGKSSLDAATLASKIKNLFFPKNDNALNEKYFFVEKDDVVGRFINLVNVFLETQLEDIQSIVDSYLHGEKEIISTKKEVDERPISSRPAEVKLTGIEIKSQIESQFKKGADGQFEDVAAVYTKLAEYAQKYNDPKIEEMLYFDESTGQFKWAV